MGKDCCHEPDPSEVYFDREDVLLFGMMALMSNALPSYRFLQDMKAYLQQQNMTADGLLALPLSEIERHVLTLGEALSRHELDSLRHQAQQATQ